ncbi:MAG: hypothetical protein COB02_09595 [Candidatus Cloacimonadota bacterium]|nr:MAG: hypothetical protein COB02_09595 [Candidatus Cloacimonadota bacterium]
MKIIVKVKTKLLILFIYGVLSLNLMAIFHVYSMTTFVKNSEIVKSPKQLSISEKIWILLTGVKIPRPINNSYPSDHGVKNYPLRR